MILSKNDTSYEIETLAVADGYFMVYFHKLSVDSLR